MGIKITSSTIVTRDTLPGVQLYAGWTAVPITYTVTVNNGTGSNIYAVGATVNIVAGAAPAGQVFDKWVTTSLGVTFANENSASTSFTMPDNAVTVTATYKTVAVTTSSSGYVKGTSTDFVITVDADISSFLRVLLNGEELDDEHYDVDTGSTIVTISSSYLRTLSTGVHDIDVVFEHVTVSAKLTVSDAPDEGLETWMIIAIAVAVIAAIAAAVWFFIFRK